MDMTPEWMKFDMGIDAVTTRCFRVRCRPKGVDEGSLLNRYEFIADTHDPQAKTEERGETLSVSTSEGVCEVSLTADGVKIALRDKNGKENLSGVVEMRTPKGFIARFPLTEEEGLMGLGDQQRDVTNLRGTAADMWVQNVVSYIPIPFLTSTRGYGVMVNTTRRHQWDLGKGNPDEWRVRSLDDYLDIYLFLADEPAVAVQEYTAVTGRPPMPPKYSLGFWFICRYFASGRDAMNDAIDLRERKIPCDVIGLEPGWMETVYDYTTEQNWKMERFAYKPSELMHVLRRKGFSLELWLCCDYDLSFEEERRIGAATGDGAKEAPVDDFHADDEIQDARLVKPTLLDKDTKPEEPWFDHLKQFVNQGVDFFKMDAADQVREHPDRRFAGNGETDETMHNLCPLLNMRQMYEGFAEQTSRRPLVFNPNGWIGIQHYAASWAGDTGGGAKTVVANLNLAYTGHGFVSCDMGTEKIGEIHHGFLLPIAQINSFGYFRHPRYMDDLYDPFVFYARLRSRLIPYLYTVAEEAHRTGMPMFRPLGLLYSADAESVACTSQYMLGGSLMVTCFDDKVHFPTGRWLDFWTGDIHDGGATKPYTPPTGKGGGLFLREGRLLPMGPMRQHVNEQVDEGFTLYIFPDVDGNASGELYDDDGTTFAFEKGEFVRSEFNAKVSGDTITVTAPAELKIDAVRVYGCNAVSTLALNGTQTALEATDDGGAVAVLALS